MKASRTYRESFAEFPPALQMSFFNDDFLFCKVLIEAGNIKKATPKSRFFCLAKGSMPHMGRMPNNRQALNRK